MALNAIQVNSEVGKQSGYSRAKGFKIKWTKSGMCFLYRYDCEIRYEKGSWGVFLIDYEKNVSATAKSTHHSLYMALKSVF